MDTIQFNQEACDACKTFAETTNSMFDKWSSSSTADDGVESVQENNPPSMTLGQVLAKPGVD